MKIKYVLLPAVILALLITNLFISAYAAGYTKSISIEGTNDVEYTYVKDEEPTIPATMPSSNNQVIVPVYTPYYNPYALTPNYGYGYGGSYIQIGYPRTYVFPGFKPNRPIHRPMHKPMHKPEFNPKIPPENKQPSHKPFHDVQNKKY